MCSGFLQFLSVLSTSDACVASKPLYEGKKMPVDVQVARNIQILVTSVLKELKIRKKDPINILQNILG